jgi:hypothetical protein
MSELFQRNDAVLADVNTKQRLITLVAVPWDIEAEVEWRGEVWNEVQRRGAYDGIQDHAGRVRVNREHKIGKTVGRLVFADPWAEDGFITRAKISETDRGNDTLGLAEDDAISGSVGYYINDPADVRLNRRTKLREVVRAWLDHLALVESPTWPQAKVLEVRDKSEDDGNPPAFAATLNAAWSDPEYLRAIERLNSRQSLPSG